MSSIDTKLPRAKSISCSVPSSYFSPQKEMFKTLLQKKVSGDMIVFQIYRKLVGW